MDRAIPFYRSAICAVCAAALYALTGCAPADKDVAIHTLADMRGHRLGYLSGTMYRDATEPLQEGIEYVPFNDIPSSMVALREGKLEGVVLDDAVARMWVAKNAGVFRLAQIYATNEYGMVFRKGSPLKEQVSELLRQWLADGTLERIGTKWCDAVTLPTVDALPKGPGHSGAKGVLRVATLPDVEPVAYVASGQVVGMEPEIARRIAWMLDRRLEFVMLSFDGLIESVAAGKVDFAAAMLTITDERKQSVDFSVPYYFGGLALVVRGEHVDVSPRTTMADSFRRTFIEEARWRLVLGGLARTLFITAMAILLGTLLAFPVWLLRTSEHVLARWCGNIYVVTMQGTPILVVLMILYYVVFVSTSISGEMVAIFGFALNFAAYAGEMLRTGVAAVSPGQREAALALGFTPFEAFWRVIFPQALKHILPVYRGEAIGLLKSTSIVGYIAVIDLTKASDLIRARTYEAFFPLVSTAVIYFAFAALMTWGFRRLERKFS